MLQSLKTQLPARTAPSHSEDSHQQFWETMKLWHDTNVLEKMDVSPEPIKRPKNVSLLREFSLLVFWKHYHLFFHMWCALHVIDWLEMWAWHAAVGGPYAWVSCEAWNVWSENNFKTCPVISNWQTNFLTLYFSYQSVQGGCAHPCKNS